MPAKQSKSIFDFSKCNFDLGGGEKSRYGSGKEHGVTSDSDVITIVSQVAKRGAPQKTENKAR
ncbi:hypothetical protein ACSZNK_19875 [Aeromonas hydrophila]